MNECPYLNTKCNGQAGGNCNDKYGFCQVYVDLSRQQRIIEDQTLDLGRVNCACGCGQEASQLHRGIPITNVNPMVHYRKYKANKREEEDRATKMLNQMNLGSLLAHG